MKVLTHWDTDGIVSASKLLEVINTNEVYVPRIGSWRFKAIPPEAFGDVLYVLDYSLPQEDWVEVCKRVKDLVYIDHHPGSKPPCGKTVNPALEGEAPPSASVVVSQYFNLPLDWRDAVAIAADLVNPEGNPIWEEIVRKEGLDKEKVKEAAALLNACYRLNDYDCIKRYIFKLKDMSLEELYEDQYLWNRRREVLRRIDELVKRAECERVYGIKVCKVKGDPSVHNFTNALWKRLREGETIVITIDGERARIYCRGGNRDYTELIKMLKEMGLDEVGGKVQVCSAYVEPQRLEEVLNKILVAR